MSVYKVGESEEYDKNARAASLVLDALSQDPELRIINDLVWRLLASLPSAPIKVVASFLDDRYYPLVLVLSSGEFSSYLSRNHGVPVVARSRERIAALRSVYETARRKIDFLDTEFRAYIERIADWSQIGLDNLPFPPDQIRRRFCAPDLSDFEVNDILSGLPFISSDLGVSMLTLGKSTQLASKIKSCALNRFYLAFLSSFALRILDFDPSADVWSLVDSDETFSCAISDALLAVEYPETIKTNMPHLMDLIASFESESS